MRHLGCLLLAVMLAAPAQAEPLTINARPITVFHRGEPDRRDFGKLTFRGGLVLSSAHEDFGGLSGLRLSADGTRLTAVTDRGFWLTARVAYDKGAPTSLTDADIRPIPRPGGGTLPRTRDRDVEALEIDGSRAFIAIERRHKVLRLDLDTSGRPTKAAALPVPDAVSRLTANAGLEAIARLPAGHAQAGALLAIAEEGASSEADHPAWLLGTKGGKALAVVRRDGYAVTDLAMLPSGDAVLLERRYRPPFSLSMRLRRIAGSDIKPGARLDGEVLLEASLSSEIDNMEALAVHRDGEATVLTLVSDDNFNGFQRTVLLQFALGD